MKEMMNNGMQPLTDDELEEAAGGGFLTDAMKAMMGDILDKTKKLLHIQMDGENPTQADGLVYFQNKEDAIRAQLLPTLDTPPQKEEPQNKPHIVQL